MLDPKLIRHSMEVVVKKIQKRGLLVDVAKFNALEQQRKQLQTQMQTLQNERNIRSKAVGFAKADGKEVKDALIDLKVLSDSLKTIEEQFIATQTELDNFLAHLPNIPHDSVPEGKSEEDNQLIRQWGQPKHFTFTIQDHVTLGAMHGWMDFETAAKLAGSRFMVLRGPFA